MRYSPEKKKQTHQQIVTEAARLFRESGYSASGVDAVMEAAGLTAGGFYAHFENKSALLGEVVERCLNGGINRVGQASREDLNKFLAWYLSTAHRDNPGKGCGLPTLAGEIPRQPGAVRAGFTKSLVDYRDVLARHIDAKSQKQRRTQAILILASMAGAMLLARAVDDDELSQQILNGMLKEIQPKLAASKPRARRRAK